MEANSNKITELTPLLKYTVSCTKWVLGNGQAEMIITVDEESDIFFTRPELKRIKLPISLEEDVLNYLREELQMSVNDILNELRYYVNLRAAINTGNTELIQEVEQQQQELRQQEKELLPDATFVKRQREQRQLINLAKKYEEFYGHLKNVKKEYDKILKTLPTSKNQEEIARTKLQEKYPQLTDEIVNILGKKGGLLSNKALDLAASMCGIAPYSETGRSQERVRSQVSASLKEGRKLLEQEKLAQAKAIEAAYLINKALKEK